MARVSIHDCLSTSFLPHARVSMPFYLPTWSWFVISMASIVAAKRSWVVQGQKRRHREVRHSQFMFIFIHWKRKQQNQQRLRSYIPREETYCVNLWDSILETILWRWKYHPCRDSGHQECEGPHWIWAWCGVVFIWNNQQHVSFQVGVDVQLVLVHEYVYQTSKNRMILTLDVHFDSPKI
jgi:hypothetical protein